MNERETTLTQKGQVTIPVEIRTRLGLKPRDKVVFELAGDIVTLRPARSRILEGYGSVQAATTDDLLETRKRFEEGVAEDTKAEA
jgi:AbrB family looped-hinge helix DNA binding protein